MVKLHRSRPVGINPFVQRLIACIDNYHSTPSDIRFFPWHLKAAERSSNMLFSPQALAWLHFGNHEAPDHAVYFLLKAYRGAQSCPLPLSPYRSGRLH